MNRFLSRTTALHVLARIREAHLSVEYDYEKHRLILPGNQNADRLIFRLPVVFPPPAQDFSLPDKPVNYIILLVQSGSCAVGYFENGHNLDHKVFRAYMVRKKRGTSQIKHLKTKGKSRAGSRVRLAETLEFFESINERLQEYFANHQVDRILLSCSHILQPYLFGSKTTTPFDKRDPRILKIPKHINAPIYEELLEAHKFMLKGELIYEEPEQELVDFLVKTV